MMFLFKKYQCNNNSINTYVCVINIFKCSIWRSSSSFSLNIDNIPLPPPQIKSTESNSETWK